MNSGERTQAAAAVALGAALIALAPIGLRLSELGPQATAFWRFVFALPVLAAAFAFAPKPSVRDVGVMAGAGVSFALDMALFHAALVMTTVANATLYSNMTPIFAAAAGWLLFRQRIGGGFLAGAAIGLSGAALLSFARAQSGQGEAGAAGDAVALASALFYAGYLVIMSSVRQRVDVRAAMFVTTATSCIVALIITLLSREPLLPQTLRGWAVVAGLGLVVQVCGQGLIAFGVGRLPIATAAVLLWIQPVTAAGVSWALFGETLGLLAFLGGALILSGVWIVQRFGASRAADAASGDAGR